MFEGRSARPSLLDFRQSPRRHLDGRLTNQPSLLLKRPTCGLGEPSNALNRMRSIGEHLFEIVAKVLQTPYYSRSASARRQSSVETIAALARRTAKTHK